MGKRTTRADKIVTVCGVEYSLADLDRMAEQERLSAIRRMESGPQSPACEYVAKRLGTRRWVVANRLTPRLVQRGYALAVTWTKLQAIEAEWAAILADRPAVVQARRVA